MEDMDKTQRFKQTVLCKHCNEEYSTTYKRCPFCADTNENTRSGIDIQGPELYDPPQGTLRPSAPNPSPVSTDLPEDFSLDLDIDFTPELEDETSSIPTPAPGAAGGKRLAGRGKKPSNPPAGGASKPAPKRGGKGSGGRGAARTLLLLLSLLIIAAAVYIIATKAVPLVQTILENRSQGSVVDPDPQGENTGDPAAPRLSLTQTEATLTAPGASKQLIPNYEPLEEVGTLRWSSENPSVVTVSEEGRLTAVSNGTALVTVTHSSGLTASCTVHCVWDETTILENLKLNKDDFTLRSSDPSVQMKVLNIEGTPPEIVWSSENPNVASISESGLVKWVSAGSTKVAATINGTLTLECKVHCR